MKAEEREILHCVQNDSREGELVCVIEGGDTLDGEQVIRQIARQAGCYEDSGSDRQSETVASGLGRLRVILTRTSAARNEERFFSMLAHASE